MFKLLIFILMLIFSLNSLAQAVRYEDGSYYNDDYIYPETPMRSGVSLFDNTNPHPVPKNQIPVPVTGGALASKKFKKKPSNGFQEVRTGGRVGDFKEVGSENENTTYSRGVK